MLNDITHVRKPIWHFFVNYQTRMRCLIVHLHLEDVIIINRKAGHTVKDLHLDNRRAFHLTYITKRACLFFNSALKHGQI